MVLALELSQRLDLLHVSGQISSTTKKSMIYIIEMFRNKFDISLTEENGAMFITHLSIACERMKENKKIEPIEECVYSEVCENNNYNKSKDVLQEIKKELGMEFPEQEEKYIILHLCGIL